MPPATPAQRELGLELCRLRLERGLSYRVHARRMGYSAHSMFVDIERGRRLPSEALVRAYEKHFGLVPGALSGLRERALVERADVLTGERRRGFAAAAAQTDAEAEAQAEAGRRTAVERSRRLEQPGQPGQLGQSGLPPQSGLDRVVLLLARVVDAVLDLVSELCAAPELYRRAAERVSSGA